MVRTPAVDKIINKRKEPQTHSSDGSTSKPNILLPNAKVHRDDHLHQEPVQAARTRGSARSSHRTTHTAEATHCNNSTLPQQRYATDWSAVTRGSDVSAIKSGLTGLEAISGSYSLRQLHDDGREGRDSVSEIILEGVRVAVLERLTPAHGAPCAFSKTRWLFDESDDADDPVGKLDDDMQNAFKALAQVDLQRRRAGADGSLVQRAVSTKGSTAKREGFSKSSKQNSNSAILRELRMAHSPEQSTAHLMVHNLSAPANRPKSVRISTQKDEMRFYEKDFQVGLLNRENPTAFLAAEGRWGLRIPTPNSVDLEEEHVLFRKSYPAYAPAKSKRDKQKKSIHKDSLSKSAKTVHEKRSKSVDLITWQDDMDDVEADPSTYALRGWRTHTPGRMGFAGNLLGEMAYYTNLVPSTLRQQQAALDKWSRHRLFTPEHEQAVRCHGFSAQFGAMGPPSRHVQTRAGRVVDDAKKRAMMLSSPRSPLSVRDAGGSYQNLPGIMLSPADARPLHALSPYPVFCTAANHGYPISAPLPRLPTPPSQWGDAETEGQDEEVRKVILQDLMRKGLVPRPIDPNAPKPTSLTISVEEMRQKNLEYEHLRFEKMVHHAQNDLSSARIKWGPNSKAGARLEAIRASPDRQKSLQKYVEKELPQLLKDQHANCFDVIQYNRSCVSHLSTEKEREREQEALKRSESVPLTLINHREWLLQRDSCFEHSQKRRMVQLQMEEHTSRLKIAAMHQEVQACEEAAELESQRNLRVRQKSESIREREFSQPFLTALMILCFATRLNPKARKLVPKKKTNVKFVVRIQRWWRLIQSFLQDPFRRGNLKELMDTKDEKILSRARMMIHTWQKQKHVAAVAYFLRELRDDRPDVLLAVNAKFTAVRVIQRCVRTFILSRQTSWLVWELQWIRLERGRNRKLIREWKLAWKNIMFEISKLVKVVPSQKNAPKGKQSRASPQWVGSVMDNFIANLPDEVKNIIEVPAEIRRWMLARHKVLAVHELVLRLDERKRIVTGMRANRKVRDELCQTFPHLEQMDLNSPDLRFLKDVDEEPAQPHLPIALQPELLLTMLLTAQDIARGKLQRPSSPAEEVILKAIPGGVEHAHIDGVSLDDPTNRSQDATLGKYLGRKNK
mmetsp:Transcript_4591/g.7488  ORF Transcript_4591/g.7488 Transcript_4591/m.7488 type:complete len:1129 (-) Transcript_4591:232-3618(-)|eukprot:CAMPEP_0179430266 /NCGR_PEP_ID=MMETSP0799-20121207/15458_1 /TAXON_ID=46947 /ORGANISM="Geminigera cryophila, Strain CCMP2564" /LENGTH=1128 /DNA_ID=CAMNT_0021206629 /DNA_START=205 /DNA_END=3591 /DNA_ORIENTATION=-